MYSLEGGLAFSINVEISRDAADGFVLRVGDSSFAFRDAQFVSVPILGFYTYRWAESGLELNVGELISVELRR